LLARHMARAGAALLQRADVLVPVPLHRWRLFRRVIWRARRAPPSASMPCAGYVPHPRSAVSRHRRGRTPWRTSSPCVPAGGEGSPAEGSS
jgi:hypothetical protein